MSDYSMWGAFLVADEIAHQGRMQQRRHNDNLHQLAADNALLGQQYDYLAQRFRTLVDDYNALRQRAIEVAKDSDAKTTTIAQLQKANADLQTECEKLREAHRVCRLDLALTNQIVRQDHPDIYLPDDY